MSATPGASPPPTAVQPLRIALVTDTYHPIVGGGETHARLMVDALTQQGHTVTVLTQHRLPETPRRETLDGAEVLRLGKAGHKRLGKYLMIPAAVARLWSMRREIDVVYVCGLRAQGLTGMLARTLTGRPVVLRSESCGELSGSYIWGGRPAPVRALLRCVLGLRNALYRRADAFMAISRVIREEYLACGVAEHKVAVIPNGVDLSRFEAEPNGDRTALRRDLGLPEGAKLLVYTGKLNRGKGLESLVDAFTALVSDHPDARLVLVGSGANQAISCEDDLRRRVTASGLDDRVTFTGYTTRVPEYLRASDLFVFPSESEAFGLSLVEAMACGLPAVATGVGGILDILDRPGLGRLVPVGDTGALTEALDDLLKHPEETAAMAERGRDSVRERFDAHAVARQHAELFATLVRPERRP